MIPSTQSAPPAVSLVCEAFERALAGAETYAGRSGPICLHLYEQYLLALFDMSCATSDDGEAAAYRDLIDRVGHDAHHAYSTAEPPARLPDWCRVVDAALPVIEFDRCYHESHYQQHQSLIAPRLVPVRPETANRLASLATYMFVLRGDGVLVVYDEPYEAIDIVSGRAAPRVNGAPVTHAQLAAPSLRAIAAGELTFVIDGSFQAVVANLKSGHFRPPAYAKLPLQAFFEDQLGIVPNRVVVLPLFAHGDT